jgi:hypothetical protein
MAKSRHFDLAVWHFSDRKKNKVQIRASTGFFDDDPFPQFFEDEEYRRAPAEPEKITINGIEINAPLRSAEDGQEVWIMSFGEKQADRIVFNTASAWRFNAFKSGQLFATAADAEAAHRAVTLALGGEV